MDKVRQETGGAGQPLVKHIGAGSVVHNFLWSQTTYILTIVTGVLIARVLGPHQRGLLAAAILWPALVANVGLLGIPMAMGLAVRRDPSGLKDACGEAFGTALWLGLAECVLFAAIMPFIVPSAAAEVTWWSVLYLAIIPLSHAGWVAGSTLKSMGWYSWAGFLAFMNTGGYCLALAVFWMTGLMCFQMVIVSLLVGIAISATAAIAFVWVRVRPRHPGWSSGLLRQGLPFAMEQAAYIGGAQVTQLLILMVMDPAALGRYVIALSYAGVGMTLANAMGEVLFYKFAERSEDGDGRGEIESAFRLSMLSQWIPFACLASVACFVIPLLFGAGYVESVWPAVVLAAAGVVKAQTNIFVAALRARGMAIKSGGLGMVSVMILCVTLPPLMLRMGLTGCAVAVAVANVFEHLAFLWYCRLRLGLDPAGLYGVGRGDVATLLRRFAAAANFWTRRV
ncbi:MAG: hypothetical protein C0404_08790 [Verrucomicrobia bacterium]|nr:hypothetical protein [Verrucomicrobiota bacterium]